jgi:hypothetical protein
MAKKSILILISFMLLAPFSWAASNPWSNLKKIYFYNLSGDISAVKENLAQLDAQDMIPAEKIELLQKLNELGDRYYEKKNFPLANAFYQKILLISPQDAWPIYNKLERINKLKVYLLWNFKNIGRQFELVNQDFSSTFLLLNNFLNVLFFSSLLLFYLASVVMFLKYFKLVTHDFILGGDSKFQSKKLVLLLVLLLWPLAVLGGWGYYPFLFCGFMWFYFDHDDRINIKRIVGILLAMTIISSVNNYMQKNLQSPGFQTIKNIYAGQLYPEQRYNLFDNELKVIQAVAYYNQHKTDTALDILQATGNNYNSTLKLNLLGNIHFKKGNIGQSIQFYRRSLSIDDHNQVTLKNFTLALLKNNDPQLFDFYTKNYPAILSYKDKISVLQTIKLPQSILWKRLLSFPWKDFHAWYLLSNIILEFFKIPVLLACLIMLVYISLLKKLSPVLGQSTFCNKCGKIIKKKSIEQSHTLCEDCYQLFLIKDPIFLEAKIIKEREIGRQSRFNYFLGLIASLFIPGFNLNFKGKSNVFTFTFLLFFNVFGLYLFNALTFNKFFGTIPMFINLIGILAIILYLAINIYSMLGDDHGF